MALEIIVRRRRNSTPPPDPEARGLLAETGRVLLDREYLARQTRHGGASLAYGYAMTAHLA